MKLFISMILLFNLQIELFSQDNISIVAVGKASNEKEKIFVVSNFDSSSKFSSYDKKNINNFYNLIASDFSFYSDVFSVKYLKSKGEIENGDFLISLKFTKKKSLKYSISLKRLSDNTVMYENTNFLKKSSYKKIGHYENNKIYFAIKGKKSIFNSKIIFVSDKGSTKRNPIKELYMIDFDGGSLKRLTRLKGIVISPAFSYDGKTVLFSLIKNKRGRKKVSLYMLNLRNNQMSLLSNKKGINSGAVFMPNGKDIALTLSHQGNAEIYTMNIKTKKLQRLTKSYTPDVDPSVNNTGKKLTFLSGRPGKPMIYTLSTGKLESNVKRISFVGKFNATPRFSPDGQEIAFSSWLDNRFDIFRVDQDGNNLYRLTKDFGSNEDPSYSNDGQFISFSSLKVISTYKAVQNIVIMSREGRIIKTITSNFGKCKTPRWSR